MLNVLAVGSVTLGLRGLLTAWPCRLGSRFCFAQPLGVAAVGVLRVGRFVDVFRKLGDGFNGWAIYRPVDCRSL